MKPTTNEEECGDGKPLMSVRHTQRISFFKGMWLRIFCRPKFTDEAMESRSTYSRRLSGDGMFNKEAYDLACKRALDGGYFRNMEDENGLCTCSLCEEYNKKKGL